MILVFCTLAQLCDRSLVLSFMSSCKQTISVIRRVGGVDHVPWTSTMHPQDSRGFNHVLSGCHNTHVQGQFSWCTVHPPITKSWGFFFIFFMPSSPQALRYDSTALPGSQSCWRPDIVLSRKPPFPLWRLCIVFVCSISWPSLRCVCVYLCVKTLKHCTNLFMFKRRKKVKKLFNLDNIFCFFRKSQSGKFCATVNAVYIYI